MNTNKNEADILFSGEKLCPVTNKKCQGLCPAPRAISNGFTEETGWSGGTITKCQEGIYLMFEGTGDEQTQIRYLSVEAYTNARLPLSKNNTQQSNIIGWGNYEKEYKKPYRKPFDRHIFFKDPITQQEQKNFLGQVFTKVTPMNLQLADIPVKNLYTKRFNKIEKADEETFLNFRSGFLLDLRLLRMIKETDVLNGANNMHSSAAGLDSLVTSTPYETPVNYTLQYQATEKMEEVYSSIQEHTPQIKELIALSEGSSESSSGGEGITYADVKLSFPDIEKIVEGYYLDFTESDKRSIPQAQLVSFVIDKVIKLYLKPKVFKHFAGMPLFSDGQSDETEQYPDLYIYAWDKPFDDNDFDFTLYHLSGKELINNTVAFPEVSLRVPEGIKPPAGMSSNPEGLESKLGLEVLQSYFIDAGVQVGALSAPERSYLNLLGTTYVANLTSFKK